MEEPVDDTPPDLRLEINAYKLDQEWQSHAEQAEAWSRYAARCRFRLDERKGELDVEQMDQKRRAAEAYEDIQADPQGFGLKEKPTIPDVANAVVLHPINKPQAAVDEAKQAVMQARYSLDVAEGAVSALKDRKHALQDLVELHLSGYSGGPKQRSAGQPDHRQGRRGRQRDVDDKS